MDPKQQTDQSNRNNGNDFVIPKQQAQQPDVASSNHAADIIRQQLNSIYGPEETTSGQPTENSAHFNPFSAPQQGAPQDPAQAPQTVVQQPQSAETPPLQQTTPANSQNPATPTPLHYNPYHKPTSHQPTQSQQQPGAAPGPDNYRKNYTDFTLPGTQVTASQNTPQPLIATPPPPPTATLTPVVHDPTATASVSGDLAQKPTIGDLKEVVVKRVQTANTKKSRTKWKPLFVSLMVGALFLGANYNEVAVAQVKQYISPGDAISTPVIIDPSDSKNVGPEPRIIIPKINLDAPVVYDVNSYDESAIQDGLERGVVHYGNTTLPGEIGNNVILGHSSNNYFNSGEYKFAFVLLFRLEVDDTFILNYEGTRYVYRVFEKKVVEPNDFSVIQPSNKPIVTLITCTPPGTSWKRLIIKAEQISPNPNDAKVTNSSAPTGAPQLPSNAPSLWDNLRDSIF